MLLFEQQNWRSQVRSVRVFAPNSEPRGPSIPKSLGRVQVDPQEPGGYTKQPLPLEEKARRYPEFVEASPRGLVPAVTHFGHHIWESIHVVEYIDSVFTGNCHCMGVLGPVALLLVCTTAVSAYVLRTGAALGRHQYA